MGFKIVKSFSSRFYNTGGGNLNSSSYNLRAEKNKKFITDICESYELKPKRILEIGFGKYPKCLELLDNYFSPDFICGLEKLIITRASKIKTFEDFKQLPKDIKFDLVYTIDVLEHVTDPYLLNQNISNFCHKDSLIIHSIDLTSHYHGSSSINSFKHYLYSKKLWNLMTSNRSSFTNRIRAKEWQKFFNSNFKNVVFEQIEHPLKKEILHKFKFLKNNDTISRVNVSMRPR